MKKLLPKTLLAVLATISFAFQGFSQNGCMTGWQYSMPITVSNANTSALTDFQVRLFINTGALISQGKMNVDATDMRFIDDCCNELCYYIEDNSNSDSTVVWVKVPSMPASGSATINMVYGNSTATTTTSNPSCVFDIYEDFDSGSQSSFTSECGSISESFAGGEMTASWSSNGITLSNAVLPMTSKYTVESMVTGATGTWPGFYWYKATSQKSYAILINTTQARISVAGSGAGYCTGHNWASSLFTYSSVAGLWSFTWVNTGDLRADFPTVGAITTTNTLYALDEDLQLGIGGISSGTGSLTMDWVRVRKWADLDPTFSFGSETSPSTFTVQLLDLPATAGFCAQSSVMVDAGSGFSTIVWSTGDTTQTAMISTPGQVTAYAVDPGGCPSTDTIDVVEWALPTVDLGSDQSACLGDTVTLDAGAGFSSYDWSIGGTAQTLDVYASNEIVVTVFDTNGCEGIDTVNVMFGVTTADFTSSVSYWDATFTNGSTSSNGAAYSWDFGDGTTSTAQDPTHTYDTVGTYTVCLTVTDTVLGCTDMFCEDVTIDNAGLSDLDPTFFSVTPNPATDVLVVQSNADETFAYQLMDLSGKVIAHGSVKAGDNTISVEALTSGVYILQINNDHAKYATRIVKK